MKNELEMKVGNELKMKMRTNTEVKKVRLEISHLPDKLEINTVRKICEKISEILNVDHYILVDVDIGRDVNLVISANNRCIQYITVNTQQLNYRDSKLMKGDKNLESSLQTVIKIMNFVEDLIHQ